MIKKLFVKYKELISYVFFGVLTTVVSLVSFKIADVVLGEELYLISNSISWVLAVLFAYITNKLWVFESKTWDKKVVFKEMLGFFSARLFSFGVESLGLWIAISLCHMGKLSFTIWSININGNMIAKIIMQFVVLVLNYVFSKFLIFAKKGKKKETKETQE